MNILYLNLSVYIALIFSLIAGSLVVSATPRVRLFGTLFYYLTNAGLFINFFITGASSYLVTGVIFTTLTTINVIRLIKQIRRSNDR